MKKIKRYVHLKLLKRERSVKKMWIDHIFVYVGRGNLWCDANFWCIVTSQYQVWILLWWKIDIRKQSGVSIIIKFPSNIMLAFNSLSIRWSESWTQTVQWTLLHMIQVYLFLIHPHPLFIVTVQLNMELYLSQEQCQYSVLLFTI